MNIQVSSAQAARQASQISRDPTPAPNPVGGLAAGTLPPYTAIIDGHRLRQLRHQHGLSQEALAHQARIGLTTLARLESQARPHCRTHALAQLAAVLNEDPETIALLVRTIKTSPARPGRAAVTPEDH
jgi:DNA-binding XRE family transcriptional regulator